MDGCLFAAFQLQWCRGGPQTITQESESSQTTFYKNNLMRQLNESVSTKLKPWVRNTHTRISSNLQSKQVWYIHLADVTFTLKIKSPLILFHSDVNHFLPSCLPQIWISGLKFLFFPLRISIWYPLCLCWFSLKTTVSNLVQVTQLSLK